VRDAVACGDLELPAAMTPEEFLFGLAMQVNGIYSVRFVSGPELAKKMKVDDVAVTARHFGGRLLDGFGWRPLSDEWDYRETMRRIYGELFTPVVIDRIKRF
jgi:hypothetical protein